MTTADPHTMSTCGYARVDIDLTSGQALSVGHGITNSQYSGVHRSVWIRGAASVCFEITDMAQAEQFAKAFLAAAAEALSAEAPEIPQVPA